VGIDPNSLRPSFRMPLSGNTNADTYNRFPHQDLGSEIHIEVAADELCDFDKGEVRSSAYRLPLSLPIQTSALEKGAWLIIGNAPFIRSQCLYHLS
jgi:hypothetical protein